MIRRLGLLIAVLSLAAPPLAQESPSRRYRQPPASSLDAFNTGEADRLSPEEQRMRRAAEAELARRELRKLHEETAQLVALASELKAELDRTAAQQLSLAAVKKTEQIEKLAKNIRHRMKNL